MTSTLRLRANTLNNNGRAPSASHPNATQANTTRPNSAPPADRHGTGAASDGPHACRRSTSHGGQAGLVTERGGTHHTPEVIRAGERRAGRPAVASNRALHTRVGIGSETGQHRRRGMQRRDPTVEHPPTGATDQNRTRHRTSTTRQTPTPGAGSRGSRDRVRVRVRSSPAERPAQRTRRTPQQRSRESVRTSGSNSVAAHRGLRPVGCRNADTSASRVIPADTATVPTLTAGAIRAARTRRPDQRSHRERGHTATLPAGIVAPGQTTPTPAPAQTLPSRHDAAPIHRRPNQRQSSRPRSQVSPSGPHR